MLTFRNSPEVGRKIRAGTNFSLRQTRMLLKHARKDGISRNDLMQYSKSNDNTVSVLYCYNIYNFDDESEHHSTNNYEFKKPNNDVRTLKNSSNQQL